MESSSSGGFTHTNIIPFDSDIAGILLTLFYFSPPSIISLTIIFLIPFLAIFFLEFRVAQPVSLAAPQPLPVQTGPPGLSSPRAGGTRLHVHVSVSRSPDTLRVPLVPDIPTTPQLCCTPGCCWHPPRAGRGGSPTPLASPGSAEGLSPVGARAGAWWPFPATPVPALGAAAPALLARLPSTSCSPGSAAPLRAAARPGPAAGPGLPRRAQTPSFDSCPLHQQAPRGCACSRADGLGSCRALHKALIPAPRPPSRLWDSQG